MQRSDPSHYTLQEGGGGRSQGVNIDVTIGKNVAQGGPKTPSSPKTTGYMQNKSITSSGITIQVNKEGAGQSTPGSNYVNVSKIDNQRAAILAASRASSGASLAGTGNYANIPIVQDNTSNYSSPRSSICSYDSKGSSPRGSLANHPPPPPYDFQRHTGSPHSLVSPRSSISMDSKHSSPRTSITNFTNMMDKFPGARPNMHMQSLFITTQDNSGHLGQQQQSPRNITTSLLERFNEPAPPHYDMNRKSHAIPVQHISTAPAHGGPVRGPRPGLPIPEGHAAQSNMHPIRVLNTAMNHDSASHIPSINKPSTQNAVAPTMKLRGLHYDTVPPKVKEGQSEAEKKLAALTEQLEKDMHIGNTSRKGSDVSSDRADPPPPPYPGSCAAIIPVNSVTSLSTVTAQNNTSVNSQFVMAGVPSNVLSSRYTATSPYKTPLPVQITPPKPKGPTEAEKKLEALTHELESQMEKNLQGEYYGKAL